MNIHCYWLLKSCCRQGKRRYHGVLYKAATAVPMIMITVTRNPLYRVATEVSKSGEKIAKYT